MSTLDVTMDHPDQGLPSRQSAGIFAEFTRWMGAVANFVFGPADYEPRSDRGVATIMLAGSCCGDWISDEVWRLIDETAELNRSKQEEKSNKHKKKKMPKLSKNRKEIIAKYNKQQDYPLSEAAKIVKDISTSQFDASVDLAIRLDVDPRNANENIRGTVALPHGTGKDVSVLALVTSDKEEEAKAAGADHVGLDEYLEKIKKEKKA